MMKQLTVVCLLNRVNVEAGCKNTCWLTSDSFYRNRVCLPVVFNTHPFIGAAAARWPSLEPHALTGSARVRVCVRNTSSRSVACKCLAAFTRKQSVRAGRLPWRSSALGFLSSCSKKKGGGEPGQSAEREMNSTAESNLVSTREKHGGPSPERRSSCSEAWMRRGVFLSEEWWSESWSHSSLTSWYPTTHENKLSLKVK